MNKQIIELKHKRTAKVAELKAITEKVQQEKRVKTSQELTKWNTLKSEVEEMDAELETLEAEEYMNKSIATNGFQLPGGEERELKKFDLSKAISEMASGRGLTGLEKELHEDGEREYKAFGKSSRGLVIPTKLMRSFTKASHTGHASEIVGKLDTINNKGILDILGVTVYDNLTSQIKMAYSDGFTAQFYNEDAAVTEAAYNESTGKIEPRRVQAWKYFHNEYLAQSAVMPQMLMDMVTSIDAAAAKEVITQILALPALSGFDAAVNAGAALTWANVMKLKGAVKSTQFVNPKFVCGGELYASLEATRKDAGSGKMIIEEGKISAYQAVDAQGLISVIADTAADADADPTHALIFGDFSRAYVGYFGGIEILVDPFSASNNGKTKLTWHRLADASVNPNAFKAITNAIV